MIVILSINPFKVNRVKVKKKEDLKSSFLLSGLAH